MLGSFLIAYWLFFSSADALVNTGLAKLGYQYVNIGMGCSLNHVSHAMSGIITAIFFDIMLILLKYVSRLLFQMIAGQN
jgi:hypothetical protein